MIVRILRSIWEISPGISLLPQVLNLSPRDCRGLFYAVKPGSAHLKNSYEFYMLLPCGNVGVPATGFAWCRGQTP
jgi:hypothetical protein